MNSKTWFLFALVIGLLFVAFGKPAEEPPPSEPPPSEPPPSGPQLFPNGSRVRLVANPLTIGIVGGAVFDPVEGWMYLVYWNSGSTTLRIAEQFLEASIGPLPRV